MLSDLEACIGREEKGVGGRQEGKIEENERSREDKQEAREWRERKREKWARGIEPKGEAGGERVQKRKEKRE